jgi:hypothetical protein
VISLEILDKLFPHLTAEFPGASGIVCPHERLEFHCSLGGVGDLETPYLAVPPMPLRLR